MITVFEKIPDLFIQMYDAAFQTWARQFKTRGPKVAIPFQRKPGTAPLFDAEGRVVERGAWLEAEVDRSGAQPRVVIRPASEADEEAIARHVRELQGWVLH